MRLAVPPGGRLVVSLPGRPDRARPGPLGPDVVSEEIPLVQQGKVVLAEDAGPMRTRQTQVSVLVILVVVLTVGGGTAVAVLTARRLANPLRHVADRASRLGAGDFRLDPRRYQVRELDMVAEALDTSATALAQLLQRERELVGDVSHQLRSRLTALQLRLEPLTEVNDPDNASEAQGRAGAGRAARRGARRTAGRGPGGPGGRGRAGRPGQDVARDRRRVAFAAAGQGPGAAGEVGPTG